LHIAAAFDVLRPEALPPVKFFLYVDYKFSVRRDNRGFDSSANGQPRGLSYLKNERGLMIEKIITKTAGGDENMFCEAVKDLKHFSGEFPMIFQFQPIMMVTVKLTRLSFVMAFGICCKV
jgi:hypothetical protein